MSKTDTEGRNDMLKEIRDKVLVLKKSPLYEYRTKNNYFPVIGEGDHNADIVLIGEGPGRNEAKTGRPFCGAAGKILDELLESSDIERKDVYITNIIKDRPPENRDPTQDEIDIYGPFLDEQLEIIKPKVVATLGRYSMDYMFRKLNMESSLEPISKMHGKVYDAMLDGSKIKLIPLYHPAVAIYNRSMLPSLLSDFSALKEFNGK